MPNKHGPASVGNSQNAPRVGDRPRPTLANSPFADGVVNAQALGTNSHDRTRKFVGAGFLLAGVGASVAIATGAFDDAKYVQEVPFIESAQNSANGIDDALGEVGKIFFPLGLGVIGVAKLRRNTRWGRMDINSSSEPSDLGNDTKWQKNRKVASLLFAGGLPVVTSFGVAVGTATSAIGNSVEHDPGQIINAPIIQEYAPGDTMACQTDNCFFMINQHLPINLTQQVERAAVMRGIKATPVDIDLSSYHYKDRDQADIVIGMDIPEGQPGAWKPTDGCETVPVIMDTASGIEDADIGTKVSMSGRQGEVVKVIHGLSAFGRIGIVVDRKAGKACFENNITATDDMVILDTDKQTANTIVDQVQNANKDAAITMRTKEDYEHNNDNFWKAQVKPITNFLATESGLLALLSMSGIVGSRFLRNRREIAVKFASGLSDAQVRGTELLRSAKEGVLATALGVSVATFITPAFNTLQPALRAGVGYKEAMVGAAIGICGSVGGAAVRLIRPRKTIDVTSQTMK